MEVGIQIAGDDIIKQSVYDIELENINSNITQASGICFSRNGKFYESYGDLDTGNAHQQVLLYSV